MAKGSDFMVLLHLNLVNVEMYTCHLKSNEINSNQQGKLQ